MQKNSALEMFGTLWHQSKQDLQPEPGRLGLTWRISLLCALVTGVSMMFQIPEAAISCYLVIFLMKSDAIINIGTAAGFLLLLPGLIVFFVWLINLTDGSTLHIMGGIVISSIIFVYLGASTQLGEQGNVAALIIAFLLTLIVKAPFGEAVSFALREAWAMAAMPMVLMMAFNLLLGFSPVTLLRNKLCQRLITAVYALKTGDFRSLNKQIREGNAKFESQGLVVKVLRMVPIAEAQRVATDIHASFSLMLSVSMLPASLPENRRIALINAISAIHDAITRGEQPSCSNVQPLQELSIAMLSAEKEAWRSIQMLVGMQEANLQSSPKPSFFAPDALSNLAYRHFAIKTTLAAVICFLIYTTLDWQGIHTAMITCYVAALATTGETLHKLLLRIMGCIIGAVMGIAAIFFIIPNIDDIGSLMLLVFFGMMVSAWISTGPERISYAGVQVALAFLLTVLQGFGPNLSFETAQDRIFGILLGNFVVYIVFSFMWPTTLEEDVRKLVSRALNALAHIARLEPEHRIIAVGNVAGIESLIGRADDALCLLPFEPMRLRASRERETSLKEAISEVEFLCRSIWLTQEKNLEPLADKLDMIAQQFLLDSQSNGQCSQSMVLQGNTSAITISQYKEPLSKILGAV
ncbi:Multidrug resistance protein MdtO [Vibrio alginolyticus]|uniref:Multidrug resistance protein MdtO n=1 Tax=Vibrio alginolyticus TaxID=663 RepID=A0A1W6TCY5_VIBAL|nr:FUSC family protein [Vibrio alginolyticus]ARO98783.1 Multidrug resistance protein MdtO [Vibrio alginolyticus]ARP03500.1 Multidrug resistance protein MdtO [Vibrio alginolyticus]ARP08558.1 Multidrug resistance protein MdtO [Vibrio alginolyticus]ARP13633.1 Multidrug resistance protein MdtO [Vibrio alginolyticus]ARP18693.1 Multidrug resistance protein MdtO [Vibrio alginolyticus]